MRPVGAHPQPAESGARGDAEARVEANIAAFLLNRSYFNAAFELAIEFARDGIEVPDLRRFFPGTSQPVPVASAQRPQRPDRPEASPLVRVIVAGSSEYGQLLLEKERQARALLEALDAAREEALAARELARDAAAARAEQAPPSAFKRLASVASIDVPRAGDSPGTPAAPRGASWPPAARDAGDVAAAAAGERARGRGAV
eukprot:tig00001343_g8325.t1